jgi:hypothetical protein
VPDVRRLLLTLTELPDRRGFHLAWSTLRRRHQAIARRCHTARRAHQQPTPPGPLPIQTRGPAVPAFTAAHGVRIAPLLPPPKPPPGRPAHDHRTILSGMLWVVRTGAAWRDLPADCGPWETVHRRDHRWRTAGSWPPILDALNRDDAPDAS